MDFYDRNAAEYAERAYSRNLDFLLEPFCQAVPAGGRVLDLGSGPGRDSLALTARGYAVISIDRSLGLLRQHRERGGSNLVRGDLSWLPFRNGVFDGVWACASLLHVAKARLIFTLNEARRVLRSEGVLFLSVKAGAGESTDADGRFWALYEEGELADALTIAGFLPLEHSRSADLAGRDVEWINLLAHSL